MIVGIDPGKGGAIAVLEDGGTVIRLVDAPILQVGKKREYDIAEMVQILRDAGRDALLAIEQVGTRPGEGAVGAFSFGMGAGLWLGIAAALGQRIERVTPQRWGQAMGLAKGLKGKERKAAARLRAKELFPGEAARLSRKKDDGRADALLIAEYARRTFLGAAAVTLAPPLDYPPARAQQSPLPTLTAEGT